jgi:sigma-B regulation protein RsbU (phosphoserine phosphatase)
MRTNDHITLPRLLERREMTALLQALTESLPSVRLALVRADGGIFVKTDNWAQDALAAMQATAIGRGWMNVTSNQVIQTNGYRCYPLIVGSNSIGALVAEGKSSNPDYPLERALHRTLQWLVAQSLGKREMANEALERYREINLMYRVSETIGASLDAEAIPRMVLEESNRVIRADTGLVLLTTDGDEAAWETKSSFGTDARIAGLSGMISMFSDTPALSERPAILTDLPPAALAYSSVLWAPFRGQDHTLGGILLGRLRGQEVFTASDEKLLMALARQAAVAIENSRLHEQVLERERLKRELQLAREVQSSLIPRDIPGVPGWDFAAYWQPAREVSGDFYDFIARDKGQLGLAIGDVSDKGMHAALFMALTRSTLRASTLAARSPAEGLTQTNRLLCGDSTGGMFVTLFYAQLNPAKNDLLYVNAGHNPPLHYRAAKKELVELERTGIMLGFDDAHKFDQRSVQFQPGDFVFFYTDGVTESVNAENEQFGEDRLRRILRDHPGESPQEILRALQQSLNAFTGDIAPFDDITIVIAKRLK